MSPADAVGRAAAPPTPTIRAPLFSTRLLRSEIGMLFRRRRNLAILAVLAAIPIIIAVAVKSSNGGNGRGEAGGIFGSITDNGVFVAFASLFVVLTLFLPMAVAVVAGESVAGEANTGTLRYLLVVPVNRTRLLAVKYAAIAVWCVVAPAVVAVVGVLAGLLLFPHGQVTLLSGTQVDFAVGLWRLVLVVAYAALMMMAIGAIGLFVSTLTEVPVAAMAASLVLAITSEVLDAVPQLHSIGPWLPSHYWLKFADLLRDPIAYDQVQQGILVAGAYGVIGLTLAWARLGSKDISS